MKAAVAALSAMAMQAITAIATADTQGVIQPSDKILPTLTRHPTVQAVAAGRRCGPGLLRTDNPLLLYVADDVQAAGHRRQSLKPRVLLSRPAYRLNSYFDLRAVGLQTVGARLGNLSDVSEC